MHHLQKLLITKAEKTVSDRRCVVQPDKCALLHPPTDETIDFTNESTPVMHQKEAANYGVKDQLL